MNNEVDKEKGAIALHFDGDFVRGESVTVRTLAHALLSIQRMVDKALIFEKRGVLKKHDALPNSLYSEADMVVGKFEKGCVKVPLLGLKNESVVSMLKGVFHDPYHQSISNLEIERHPLVRGYQGALNRAYYGSRFATHHEIIDNFEERALRYFSEAVFRDFDNLISPLRSRSISVDGRISLELFDRMGVVEYDFDKSSSLRFHKIISAKQFGPLVEYEGRLTAFGESKRSDFPYVGKFYSFASKQEHKILVGLDEHADALRPYNAKKGKKLSFIGSPVEAWGAFDDKKGDIVLLKIQ